MAKKKPSRAKLQATASAKAEVVAKASYERKRVTTEVIPPDVTRARTSAWLDLVSPLTEWAGLKGDELRLKRAQLRLQQEDVLGEIVRRAQTRIKGSTAELKPIQNKFLVPFLEKASLEDEESSLIDLWAGLLASAAEGGSSQHIHFVSIISQLSPAQGSLFAKLIHTKSEERLGLAMDYIKNLEFHAVRDALTKRLEPILASLPTAFDPIESKIAEYLDCLGVAVVYGDLGIASPDNFVEIDFPNGEIYSDAIDVDFSILEAVGLIRRVETTFVAKEIYSISLVYYHLASMGFHFAKACGLVRLLGEVSSIEFDGDDMMVHFDDGRSLRVSLTLFPVLLDASSLERENFHITAVSIEWEKLEEEILIEDLLEAAQGK
ncbi:DUF2442 domain-containing protein [Bradyrhizobium sp. CCBAU 53338]|uniref:Abi-alpha family protein n=1 Tax=Bradyrhizobium sp. CCBAU 53338 TaxID=1325111 RepID=UPI00188C14B9|nr:DUF2442 domain-containing protein [Bradyrhizobium sp. CCBAU 53338]QOZ52665.1 hypothetical protein XH90_15785 [Bradyrhizobium sp. CCBAU 53338]